MVEGPPDPDSKGSEPTLKEGVRKCVLFGRKVPKFLLLTVNAKNYDSCVCAFDLPDDETILKVIEGLNGIKLAQRTPDRVAHRRSDLIRKRTVFEAHTPFIEVNEDGQREIEFTLRCESGTYVKETVHGDNGRTQPSVAALIKAKCNVVWLDVGDIHAD